MTLSTVYTVTWYQLVCIEFNMTLSTVYTVTWYQLVCIELISHSVPVSLY